VSEKIRGQVKAINPRAPISVLPVFVDVERFRGTEHIPSEQKRLLWIGRFEKEKDPLAALAIYKQVRARSSDARLVMLGSGSLEKDLRQQTEGLPVEFPGWGDPKAYLEKADVVLCTSRYESWGASIIEALAAGVPVVAPDVGIAREAGAIVVPRADLAEAVTEVLSSGQRGELKLELLDKEEWAQEWEKSLI
jgi:glycosyltransferase involved in cell wall biosynthesis